MYSPYVTAQEYESLGYSAIPSDKLNRFLIDASRNIDTLTFNRIVKRGFVNLSNFQQEVVREVCCKQADFLYQNADAIASVFDSYSINSVSMKFGTGFTVYMEGGVPIQSTVYSLLEQTGLCCRLAR